MSACNGCYWWGWPNDDLSYPDRPCRLMSSWPYLDAKPPKERIARPNELAFVSPFAGADGAEFFTNGEFGCVQWVAAGPPSDDEA